MSNRPMIRLISLAGAMMLAGAAGTAAAQETLRIGTEGAYPPWNFTETDGELAGFEIDLGNAMCERMGVECEWVAQDWDGIIPALLNGRYDMIMAGMSITDERRERIAFSSGYVTDPAFFVSEKDSPLQAAETIEEVREALNGMVVGVQTATIHQNFIEAEIPGIEVRLYDAQENMELDLATGRIDAGLADNAAWQVFLEKEEGADYATFGPRLTGAEFEVFGEGVGVGTRKEDTELLVRIDAALEELKEDGTVGELSMQYFGYDMAMY